jgi:hypothetical protein
MCAVCAGGQRRSLHPGPGDSRLRGGGDAGGLSGHADAGVETPDAECGSRSASTTTTIKQTLMALPAANLTGRPAADAGPSSQRLSPVESTASSTSSDADAELLQIRRGQMYP